VKNRTDRTNQRVGTLRDLRFQKSILNKGAARWTNELSRHKNLFMEARADERARFYPTACKYRRHVRTFAVFVVGGLVTGLFASSTHVDGSHWLGFVFAGCVLIGMVGAFTMPRLRCPQCQEDAGGELQWYCPECGGSPLEKTWFFAKSCAACGKRLARGKSRGYRVRFCTQCGAYLDEKGV
jgi:hypothetical protein